MTDLDKANPQFTIAIRGYDRYQVDEYLLRMQQLLADAEERTRRAEATETASPHAEVAPRIAQIFELATVEADEYRADAEDQARRLTGTARAKAEKMMRSAKQAAETIAQRSLEEHSELLGELAEERDQMRAEVVLLERQRTELAAHLRRLLDAIGKFAAVADEAPRPDDGARTRQLKAVASN
jgi:cell division septum initiation protein DivIVA